MPLNPKGVKIMRSMVKTYGGDEKKAKRVFYASLNAGKIKGVEGTRRKKIGVKIKR